MNTTGSDEKKPLQQDAEFSRLLNATIDELDSYQKVDISMLAREMGMLQRNMSLLRNRLIELYRREGSPSDSETARALNTVNLALIHVIGVGYPVSGIDRNLLSVADDLLKGLRVLDRREDTGGVNQ